MKKDLLSNNKMIAAFMGLYHTGQVRSYILVQHEDTCGLYHCSWDWLLPVIEKISKKEFYFEDDNDIDSCYPEVFGMYNSTTNKFYFKLNRYPRHENESLITAAYEAIIEYIEHENYLFNI